MSTADPRRWRDDFLAQKEETRALTEGLSAEAFNRAPEAGAWSVAQCLDHLCETAGPLVPRLRAALSEAPPKRGGPPSRLGLFDRLFVRTMQPSRWLKMPAPGAYRPAAAPLDPRETLDAFAALQDDLAACAGAAAERDWRSARVASPAFGWMRLSAGGWLAGTCAHQRRHLAQARAALDRLPEA